MIDQADKLRRVIDSLKVNQKFNVALSPNTPVVYGAVANPEKKTSRIITVTSGKGGVGKTNITINLAIALSEQGQRVIVLDADFGLANIDVLFGIVPQYTLADVIKNHKNIMEILSEGPKNIRFISGGSGVEDLVKLDSEQIMMFIDNMALLDKLADIIIVDTGAGLSENVMSFILAADEVILITTPEPTSITDAYALIKMVSNRDRTKRMKIIVNKAENTCEANDIMNKLILVAEKFLGITLEPIGYILNDDNVMKAVKQQNPFLISYPKSQASRSIKEISAKLIENAVTEESFSNTGIRGFINKFVGILKM